MDSYEATRVVFSRLQSLDPDNASKIMGYILLQDTADHDMIRLAFGPESLLHHLMLQAKSHLSAGLFPLNKSPASAATASLSYASVLNGTTTNSSSSSSATTAAATADGDSPEYRYFDGDSHPNSHNNNNNSNNLSFVEEVAGEEPLQGMLHRRSYSMPSGTCLYFARGFCKNGTTCRFFHTSSESSSPLSGLDVSHGDFDHVSSSDFAMKHRGPAAVQQKHAAAAAAAAAIAASQFGLGSPTNNSLPYNKCLNFLLQHQNDTQPRSAALGLAGGPIINPSARQIYLTFPADSTFTEEDVSNYFSIYGPVQDVRIPYQQKRMFGFVTFIYPDTVKLILAKGNPHFVCDSRVLVKPYKEKGKVAEKKHHLHLERGEYAVSPCSSPCGIDSRDQFDFPFSPRMFYGNQETMLRKKLMEEEAADLSFRQAVELQGRRLMNLQLLDLKNNLGNRRPLHHHHHHPHYPHSLSPSSPIPSPTLSRSPHLPFSNRTLGSELPGAEYQSSGDSVHQSTNLQSNGNDDGKNNKEEEEEDDSSKSMEPLHNNESHGFDLDHILPDNLFTSPKKSASERPTAFSEVSKNPNHGSSGPTLSSLTNNSNLVFSATTTTSSAPLDMAPTMNSCFLQLPRLSSNHGAIGM